ncbi:LPS-assembly protein LptD [Occallatibacter riparius]|uniref:LPS assembly protein LptD n=1 Tax=Occallatibacter riparius TaxID=1002689 RepID=A0A9J7BWP4_9BACT|nr:LPS assembly protein LptD [Occallatibacter riparius]UWZ86234.1 LPS assembly protein LptD [Occallatibacter riparius]
MAQTLTNALPPAQSGTSSSNQPSNSSLPDDPGQEVIPVAQPEPAPVTGVPVSWKADRQTWAANTATLYGVTEFHYRDYVISADKVTYNQVSTELEAEGHLEVRGGPDDVVLTASRGTMRLNDHTARFYDVTGTMGVRGSGRNVVYSTANPFIISARVLIQAGERDYRVVDGTMTNCRLPNPDWQLLAKTINVKEGQASAKNTYFKFLGVPLFYLPYMKHPTEETGRQSGFLIPVFSVGSSIRGFTLGEQYYLVLNRSMDMVVGTEYYSRRGWAPNGDFRYKGPGLDHLTVRWNALFDRGFYYQPKPDAPPVHVNQGGADINALVRKDFSPETRIAGNVEYLSNYTYRLVFNDSYWQAINSQVKSDLAWTRAHNGYVPSVETARLQTFVSPNAGNGTAPPSDADSQFNEVRILHLPSVRFDVLDRPLESPTSPLYWGLGSSIAHMSRSEPNFHAHNDGRLDFYPHLSLPIVGAGWSIVPQVALRGTWYTTSQVPDLVGTHSGVPAVRHEPLHRLYGEAALDLRPPALERDFAIGKSGKVLRHVIEPELTYHFVGGIGEKARDVLLVDTTDIPTDTNEVGFSLTQRFYVRPRLCTGAAKAENPGCDSRPREWASWQILQRYFLDPTFGGALIPGRRNVFSSTLDLTGVAFLTEPRNLSPLVSRLRFEAIHNLRVEWDLDYDPKPGRFGADNVFAGYSWGITTIGVGHALLNAPNEQGSKASLSQSQQLDPFIQIGRQNRVGFNLAMNGGYDFVNGALQYGGIQAVYNWDCCGLTVGYRRFALGTVRDETQYLYSFTLANFGSVGDIRRSNAVFRDPGAIPAY